MKYVPRCIVLKYIILSPILCSRVVLLCLSLAIAQTACAQLQLLSYRDYDNAISEIELYLEILNTPPFISNDTNGSDFPIFNNSNNASIGDMIIWNYESQFLYMDVHISQVYVSYISQILPVNNSNDSIFFLNQSSQCVYNKNNISDISIVINSTNYTGSGNGSNSNNNNMIDYFCMVKYENSNLCEVCIPGFTVTTSLQSNFCTACPMGYFKSEYGTGDCLPCQKGWSTFGLQGQISCRPCIEGTSTNGLMGQPTCSKCVEFSEATKRGSSICICVNGTSLDYTGNKCIMCTPGNYNVYNPLQSPESQDRCFSCDVGTYSSHRGSTNCEKCPPGTFNPIKSATGCILCEVNSFNPYWSQSQCIKCENGSYNYLTGSNVSCICAAGTEIYRNNNTENAEKGCLLCPMGKYQPFNNTLNSLDILCKDCEPGKYTSKIASSSCSLCTSNQYGIKSGSTSCLECKQYSIFSSPGSGGSSRCECIPGTSKNYDDTKCIPCPVGFFQPQYNSDKCIQCPLLSTTIGEGANSSKYCTYCSPGSSLFFSSENIDDNISRICTPCEPGFYQPKAGTENLCLPCPAGSYSDVYASQNCNLCFQNTFSENSGSSTCATCPLYSENDQNGSTSCKCVIGTSLMFDANNSNSNKSCIPCSPGSYQPLNSTTCLLCEPGSYSSRTTSNCTKCPIHTFTSMSGSTECYKCEDYSDTLNIGSSKCDCTMGATPSQNGKCIPCTPGSYQPFINSDHCKLCEPGSYSSMPGTIHNCTKCTFNTFAPASGSTECFACENYSEALNMGSSRCNCTMGTTLDSGGKCLPCTPGSYQPVDSTTCKLCEQGTYSSMPGTIHNCTKCTFNTFAPASGSTECFACENYSEALNMGSSRCNCTMGATLDSGGKCLPCTPGSYQPVNSTTCKLCEQGTYSSVSGTVYNCTKCAINTFSGDSGSTWCLECKSHSDALKVGSSQCDCVIGANLNYLGTSCIPCVPGTYQAKRDPGICSPCPIGTYNVDSLATMCIDCPVGSFGLYVGSTSCVKCLENSIYSVTESKCSCDTGMYNLTTAVFNYGNGNASENISSVENLNNRYWRCEKCRENCSDDNYYISKKCTSDTDIACSPCKKICPLGTYLKQKCSYSQDTVCETCASSCIRGYYIKGGCTNVSNIQCEACSTQCPPGYIMLRPCTSVKNIICEKCPTGTYTNRNTIPAFSCVECLPGYITSNLQDYCIKCEVGWYTSANKTLCVKQCPAGSYPSNINTCLLCPKYSYNVDGFSCITCMGCGLSVLSEGATSCSTCNLQDLINNNNTNSSIDNTCKI